MFNCKNCKTLESEIIFLREQHKSLLDRVMALSNPMALEFVKTNNDTATGYYGDGNDYEYKTNEFGEEHLVKND